MKRIKITNKFKDDVLKDFTNYLDKLEPGKKIEYKYTDSVTSDTKPKVIISSKAYLKIKSLVSKADGEVGWNGSVVRDGNTFTIEDIFVYPQTVTSATVTCDEMETAKWLMSLPSEVFNKLRFQGHSHVNMGISPSGVDTTMYEKYLQNLGDDDFYIFMIFNKKDDYYIEINDNHTNIIYYKNDIDLVIEGFDDFWNENKDKIKTVSYTSPTTKHEQTSKQPEYETCNKSTCKDCEKFEECATAWYKKMCKE
jgi:hypothetical protein